MSSRPGNYRSLGVLMLIAASLLNKPSLLVVASSSGFSLPSNPKNHVTKWPTLKNTQLLSLRGGSTDPSSAYGDPSRYQSPQQQPQPLQQQDPYFDQEQQIPNIDNNNVPFQEDTFQDRIDNWREYQRQHSSDYQSSMSPRDEQGRMKLLTSVSKGSRAITFFILMWRDVHLYETVDQSFKGSLRFMGVLPLTFLFVANMAGVVASITSPGHGAKKRLKAILNLDKLLEVYLILWSLARLVFSSSDLVPRELYISHILHSVFFLIQCQAVTRFVWHEGIPAPNQQAYNMPGDDTSDPIMDPTQRMPPRDPYSY